jgi:hypothetical protein
LVAAGQASGADVNPDTPGVLPCPTMARYTRCTRALPVASIPGVGTNYGGSVGALWPPLEEAHMTSQQHCHLAAARAATHARSREHPRPRTLAPRKSYHLPSSSYICPCTDIVSSTICVWFAHTAWMCVHIPQHADRSHHNCRSEFADAAHTPTSTGVTCNRPLHTARSLAVTTFAQWRHWYGGGGGRGGCVGYAPRRRGQRVVEEVL